MPSASAIWPSSVDLNGVLSFRRRLRVLGLIPTKAARERRDVSPRAVRWFATTPARSTEDLWRCSTDETYCHQEDSRNHHADISSTDFLFHPRTVLATLRAMGAPSRGNRSGLSKAIAAQIRAERAAAKLTVEQTAELAGLRYSTFRKLDNGTGVANSEQLYALCNRVYKISLREFFERTEQRLAAQPDYDASPPNG